MPVDVLTTDTDASGSEPNANRSKRKRRVAIEWTLIIVVAVLASFLVRTFVFQTFYIPSSSMNPTLWKGDRIVVNKLSVEFGTINIGDIVVFKAPPDVAKDCHEATRSEVDSLADHWHSHRPDDGACWSLFHDGGLPFRFLR